MKKWWFYLVKSGFFAAILMDLYKAFIRLIHKLNLEKLQAYGINNCSLKVLKSLSNPYQSIKSENTFSLWFKILGVPQGSIGSTFSLNVFLNDLLLSIRKTEICNFADDSTLVVLESLQSDLDIVLKWFIDDQKMANVAKFQFI